jgi:hypothetical protein
MARCKARPTPMLDGYLSPNMHACPECFRRMPIRYTYARDVIQMKGAVRFNIAVRACRNPECCRFHKPFRPEEEGAIALPKSEYGFDVIAFAGACRYREHRSIPEIHGLLRERGIDACERTVTHLVARYEELVALRLSSATRLQNLLKPQGKVVLAFDGMQPDAGHEVLWVFRDLLSGEVLLAKSLLSATAEDIAVLLREIRDALPVPIVGVVTDGQCSLRNAVALALPGVPHQLCQYHYLREALRPIYEADRHAKKELKKQVRGVRPLERKVQNRNDPEAEAVTGYCQAIRSALTDDGRPPLDAPGLRLRQRLDKVAKSLETVTVKRGTSPC